MRTLFVCLLLVVTTTAFAQVEWTTLVNTSLSNQGITTSDFIVGIGSADKHDPNARELAREKAVKKIFEKLNHRIRNIILVNKNRPGGGFQNVAAHYSTVAQAPRVVIELPHIIDVPLPPGTHNAYAVVAVNRQELIDFYTRKADKLRTEIDGILNDPLLAGDPTRAAAEYLGTYTRFEALKEAEMIILGADAQLTGETVFKTLQQYVTQQYDAIYNVDQYFESQYPVSDIQSVAHVISTQIGLQDASPAARVQIDPFTYNVSETYSQISMSLANALEKVLTVQWPTFPPPGPSISASHPLGFGRNITSRLSGTLWELGNKITVRATLRDVMTGEFQAAAVVKFNKNLRNINVDRYAPPGYETIVDNKVADAHAELRKGSGRTNPLPPVSPGRAGGAEVVSLPNPPVPPQPVQPIPPPRPGSPVVRLPYIGNGFTVELRTDRPNEGNYFYIGERTAVYVRVNRPGYFRLGYGFADGRYAILRDNQYIDGSKVNTWVKVPGMLELTEPEGSEYLRVVAQETQLPPIQTYTEGRNQFLVVSTQNAVRGGVEQARANLNALRGGVMVPDENVGNQDASRGGLRGGAMVEDVVEAQLPLITVRKW